ncbi:acetoacetate decarboxylase [Mycolicibacterium moriokaense]|nr:acetoacetate decarboxylase [Mycolicibacterium moriokaense]
MSESQHTIAGTVLTMPVRVRKADVHSAMFSVDAAAAQRLIDYSGLKVFQHRPGRAIVNVLLTRFVENDLGSYNEFTTCVMVNPPGSTASGLRALGDAGAFIHHMMVDAAFTLEAGRKIWGYPKVMADYTIRDGRRFGFDVSIDGSLVAAMEFGRGLPVPNATQPDSILSYTHLDGITRETRAQQHASAVRGRIGGVTLRLGDHPVAKELASLGLPKRAVMSMTIGQVDMTFGDATVLP